MISQTVDYSLRAMVALASYDNQVMSVREIAAVTKVPCPYLSKLMRQLVRAELVRSRRGVGGGYVLARPPGDISIWDVVEAIDGIQRPHCCPLNIVGHSAPCALHRLLNHTVDEIEQAFRAISLADTLADCSYAKPINRDH